ncbi:MAG: 2-C-methyl-D-erythritol 2,4-cyclodiphosphate synthase [Acidimicrobiia bacterium]
MRVGWGFDAHRFGGSGGVRLAGVVVDERRGLVGTSDGDVLAHAVADALLGAAALGDMGTFFPSSDPKWQGADSMELLGTVVADVKKAGFSPEALDVTVIAQEVRVGRHRDAIRSSLAQALGIDAAGVSVKASTTDGMGYTGSGEGMAAVAVVTIERQTANG